MNRKHDLWPRMFTTGALCLTLSFPAMAQLEPYQDYDISDTVWDVTTVKVHPNMMDHYLEGLKESWVAANELAVKLGHIEEYAIYSSALPQSGDFNLMLVVRFADTAALAPSKARYDAFMKEWGAEREARNEELIKDYPGMREITGQYNMYKLTMK